MRQRKAGPRIWFAAAGDGFGESGAKLIWAARRWPCAPMDGESTPVDPESRGHARFCRPPGGTGVRTFPPLFNGRPSGRPPLTHSGRWARQRISRRLEPRIAYRHPILDARSQVADDRALLTDTELSDLVGDFVAAARRARDAGFDFVDVKHCHGYLGHELLSAVDRPGRYGGSLENRMRFLREIVEGIRRDAPGLAISVRLSLFDQLPFQKGPDGVGIPVPWHGPYPYAFGETPRTHPRLLGRNPGLPENPWPWASACVPDRRKPLLQSPPTTSRHGAPERWVPSSGGSAGRCRPANPGCGAREAGSFQTHRGGIRLAISRNGCPRWLRARLWRDMSIWWDSVGWCSAIQTFPGTQSPAGLSSAARCAGRSVNARPGHGTDS